MDKKNIAKIKSAQKAIELFIKDGMTIGLGSGSTAHCMVQILGEKLKKQELKGIIGVATSSFTADIAKKAGVRLININDAKYIDIVLDGADEIDGDFNMIKGGGACLLWEKIVAKSSPKMVALVDETKIVKNLGAYPLPIEIVPFGWKQTKKLIKDLLKSCEQENINISLRGGESNPLKTDSAHYILDCNLGFIKDTKCIAERLNHIPGVVEHGLFIGIAKAVVIGKLDGSCDVKCEKFKVN